MKNYRLLIAIVPLLFAGFAVPVAQAQKPKIYKSKQHKAAKKTDSDASAEPDKVLYDRAMLDVKQRRYTEARLDLQTLINTYPDSEYLAKAKLGVADSYYNEGGDSNLTQAVDEYKNFIVFFPFLDEAQYAQMQVGMSHYRMMEKSDRDNSQAQQAEDEFRTFLLKYPESPLAQKAEQYLRDVQEVLADGEFKIGRFYYAKQDYRASAARLMEVSIRYPLYSQSDDDLLMLGNIYERAKQASKNEDDKNHWADLAAKCYDRIVRDYPLSQDVPEAKARLKLMSMPIPAADPAAVARMKQEQMYEKQHRPNPVLNAPLDMVKSSPDVYAAAHYGQPNLNPPDDLVSATDVLSQGAAAPSFSVATVSTSKASQSVSSDSDSRPSPAVDTESVDTSDSPSAAPTDTPAASGATTQDSAAQGESSSAATAPADEGSATTAAAPQSGTGSSTPTTQSSTSASANDSSTESSSKKKKGLRKIIPF